MQEKITLAHGSGGELYREMVNEIFLPAYSNEILCELGDSAVCTAGERIAFTTDGFVVNPIFFPGGDIGRLCVCGTVNDLAVSGAVPRYLSVSMIIEAGFETEKLRCICKSIAEAAGEAGVKIVTGDTKVVEGNKADGIYITTSGVGVFTDDRKPLRQKVMQGDVIICSAPVASHGVAVTVARSGMDFSPVPCSDVRPLSGVVDALLSSGAEVHAMRDPTRGGVAATLCEWARDGVDITVDLKSVPVEASVGEICAVLGFDPLQLANEGVLLASVAKEDCAKALEALKNHQYSTSAAVIAEVESGNSEVWGITDIGTKRRILMPRGEILPRIC